MTEKTEGASRRDFLKLAGTATPLAAVAFATGTTSAEAQPVDPTNQETRIRAEGIAHQRVTTTGAGGHTHQLGHD